MALSSPDDAGYGRSESNKWNIKCEIQYSIYTNTHSREIIFTYYLNTHIKKGKKKCLLDKCQKTYMFMFLMNMHRSHEEIIYLLKATSYFGRVGKLFRDKGCFPPPTFVCIRFFFLKKSSMIKQFLRSFLATAIFWDVFHFAVFAV